MVICVAPWHGVFLINSEPAEFVKAQPELLSLQLILEAEQYAFLSYDSYLDCSQFHGLPEPCHESVEIVGQLRPHEIEEVRLLVAEAKTLAERHRQAVLASFPSA